MVEVPRSVKKEDIKREPQDTPSTSTGATSHFGDDPQGRMTVRTMNSEHIKEETESEDDTVKRASKKRTMNSMRIKEETVTGDDTVTQASDKKEKSKEKSIKIRRSGTLRRTKGGRIIATKHWSEFINETLNGGLTIKTERGNVAARFVYEEDDEYEDDKYDSESDEMDSPENQAAIENDLRTQKQKTANKKGKKSSTKRAIETNDPPKPREAVGLEENEENKRTDENQDREEKDQVAPAFTKLATIARRYQGFFAYVDH